MMEDAGRRRTPVADSSVVTLRPARQSDQALIKGLVRRERLNPLSLNWRHFLVAEAGGRVVGCGQVKRHGDGSAELASLIVVPEWRRRGVAARLISGLKAQAGPPLWLTCRSTLVPFYARFGFEDMTRSPDLPPYFRRFRRLARLLLGWTRPENGLAVMLWTDQPLG